MRLIQKKKKNLLISDAALFCCVEWAKDHAIFNSRDDIIWTSSNSGFAF